jgi:hypothetical protein
MEGFNTLMLIRKSWPKLWNKIPFAESCRVQNFCYKSEFLRSV